MSGLAGRTDLDNSLRKGHIMSTNPLRPGLDKLFASLNTLHGLMLFQANRLSDVRRYVETMLARRAPGTPPLLSSSSLFFVELDAAAYETVASGGFGVLDQEFLDVIDALVGSFASFTLAQGYERFETFLFDVAAAYLDRKPAAADPAMLQKFGSKKLSGRQPAAIAEWRDFVKYHCRGNGVHPLELLRKWLPTLSNVETANIRRLNLVEWFDVLSRVRHAITHADGVLKPVETTTWSSSHHQLRSGWFPGTFDAATGETTIEMTPKTTERTLIALSDYAFAIFKHASLDLGLPWDFRQGPL